MCTNRQLMKKMRQEDHEFKASLGCTLERKRREQYTLRPEAEVS